MTGGGTIGIGLAVEALEGGATSETM
jgi:hypothetical protein